MACSKESKDELSFENDRVWDNFGNTIPILLPPLHSAVVKNDVERMKVMIRSGVSVNMLDERNMSPLHLAVVRESREAFDYLISLDDIEIDCKGGPYLNQTPLVYSLEYKKDKHYPISFINNKGPDDVNYFFSSTYLHIAASNNDVDVSRILIDKEADINAQDCFGRTPLAIACFEGSEDIIYMLLCLGADPSIEDNHDALPYVLSLMKCPEELQEILFNYTFADENVEIVAPLNLFLAHFFNNSPFLHKIIEKTTKVVYDIGDLHMFVKVLVKHVKGRTKINMELFKDFCMKFRNVASDMFDNDILLSTNIFKRAIYSDIFDLICFLCENDFELYINNWLFLFSLKIEDGDRRENKTTELLCYLASYGYGVSFDIIEGCYRRFGYCELFEILLHMEISDLRDDPISIPILLCNFNVDVSVISAQYFTSEEDLKNFFATPEKMPSLLQLSREAARRYIIQKYNVKKSVHFCTVLKYLPINQVYKDILSYKKKIYNV